MKRLLAALVFVVVVSAAIQLISGSSPVGAQSTGSMTIRGRMTLDGKPASAGAIASAISESGENLASVFLGLPDAPDEYELTVIINSRVQSGEIITVTVEPGLGPMFNVIKRVKTRAIEGASVTANLAVFTVVPAVVRAPEGGAFFASIPEFISLSPEATATVSGGGAVTVIGGSINVPVIGGEVILPVAAPVGGKLETLIDSDNAFNLAVADQSSQLRLTLLDDSRNEAINLLMDTTQFTGDGTSARALVQGLSIESATRSLDLSGSVSSLDLASLKLSAGVSAFPADSDLEIRLLAVPDEGLRGNIDALFDPAISFVDEVAFVGSFVETNLGSVMDEATVRLGVSKSWTDKHADDTIEVFTVGEDGSIERHNWNSIDQDADPQQFDVALGDGLPTVVVAAIKHVLVPTATPIPSPTSVPTPRPEPTPTSTPSPTATPVPEPTSAPVPTVTVATPVPTATAIPTPAPAATVQARQPEESGGGGCSATESGGPASVGHLGLLALPLGLIIARWI